MNITVEQIIQWLGIVAGVIGSITAIYAFMHKIFKKIVDNERKEIIDSIDTQLKEIKQNQKDLSEQTKELREEMILIMRLNQALTTELKTLGKPNGETTEALGKLNDYLINK